jgi:hypothetical protein
VALALRVLGQIARIAGRDKTASDQLNEALAHARQVEDPILASRTLRELAKLAVSQGDLASAETFLNQSLEIVLAVSAPLEIAEAREDLGTFSVEFQRDEPHGRELLAQAAQDYDTLGLTRRPAERFVLSR